MFDIFFFIRSERLLTKTSLKPRRNTPCRTNDLKSSVDVRSIWALVAMREKAIDKENQLMTKNKLAKSKNIIIN